MTKRRRNPIDSAETWRFYSPIMPEQVSPEDPDFVTKSLKTVSRGRLFKVGERAWRATAQELFLPYALSLAEPWLRQHGLRLIKHLGVGTFGHAFLTNEGTVIKLTYNQSEFEAAELLAGKKLRNVVEVYDAVVTGEAPLLPGWSPGGGATTQTYYLIHLQLLQPAPPELTKKGHREIERGCASYEKVVGQRCDNHPGNFGLNEQGEWTLLDVGPSDDIEDLMFP